MTSVLAVGSPHYFTIQNRIAPHSSSDAGGLA